MDDLTIRPAQSEDASQLAELFCADFRPEIVPLLIYGCEGAANYIRMQVASGARGSESAFFVASVQDRVVAAVELRRSPGGLFLNYIAVLRKYQGRGIGSRLLKRAIGMSGAKCGEIRLDVFEDNVRALRWYRRIGFRERQISEYLEIAPPQVNEEEPAYVSGLPQADLCHERFGFSQLSVVTAGRAYAIGRTGDTWFRVIEPAALAVSAVFRALRLLDPRRRFFAVVPNSPMPHVQIVQTLTTVRRMGADTSEVLEHL